MLRRFSWNALLLTLFRRSRKLCHCSGLMQLPDFPTRTSSQQKPESNKPASHTALRHSITSITGQGILTLCPSGPAFAIRLGPTNPWLITIAKETLFFRRAGISPALRLLVPAFSLPHAPPWVTPLASLQSGTLSYRLRSDESDQSPQFRYDV